MNPNVVGSHFFYFYTTTFGTNFVYAYFGLPHPYPENLGETVKWLAMIVIAVWLSIAELRVRWLHRRADRLGVP